MRRRVLLAVLFVLALVVLVSAGCGDSNRPDTEATKGKPWTGSSGVTKSVAGIAAREEVLARHPLTPPADQAVAGEEGVEEGEAAAESAETPEADAESADAESAGAKVREKPEPEEEGVPPKRAGPAARQQRVGAAAIGPEQSLTAGTSFLGAEVSDSGFVPPDSMGAVGPTQVLVFVNGRIRVFDKDGNPGGLNVNDAAFWAPVSNGSEPTDPGVEYDRLSGRWILSAINTQNTNNRVMLAVSSGPTITNTSSFTYFFFNEAAPPPSAPARFADYPQLGVDANAIYIGVNEFSSASAGGSFTGTSAFVIRKSSVTDGGPMVVTAFRGLASGTGPGPSSPQPATDMDPSVDEGYIVGSDNQVFSKLDVRRISDPGGTPSISGNLGVTVPTTAAPLAVPAQGTPAGGLDALDDRLFEAMMGEGPDGTDTLWAAHNISVNSSGVGGGNRDAARWYQLGTLDTTPSLVQSGTLFDTAVSNPRFFWMPSIAMNGQGHASLNTSTAGVGRFAEVASSGRLATDPAGQTDPFEITQSSSDSYNLGSSSPKRWGDYSQTVVDPNDNMTFWTFQEYTNSHNSWGVQVIKLEPPPPATPSTATPATVALGQCSVTVDVEGTSTDGSGFFDPGSDPGGPGYVDHITADVTGGVVVDGVTYTDPTHLTLDLDTRGATSGPQDLTITNPDGQEVTSPGFLTVDTGVSGPTPPCLNGTTPDSPANDNAPKVFGSADPGSMVDLYTDSSCAGGSVGTGTADEFSFPGIPVSVADDSSTTFYATATDSGSVVSACSSTLAPSSSAALTYIEDSIPPDLIIDSGPTGTTADKTPTFTFHATDTVGPIGFQCSIDAGTPSFAACSGPGNSDTPGSPLADGSYTFRVKATDAAGNSSTQERPFEVETPVVPTTTTTATTTTPPVPHVPPDTTITKGPKKKTHKRRPKFKFTSNPAGSRFQCKLDRGTFQPCVSPFKPAAKLSFGKHVFSVEAVDTAGAVDSSPAVRKFKVLPKQG
jgi:hypothetical protein